MTELVDDKKKQLDFCSMIDSRSMEILLYGPLRWSNLHFKMDRSWIDFIEFCLRKLLKNCFVWRRNRFLEVLPTNLICQIFRETGMKKDKYVCAASFVFFFICGERLLIQICDNQNSYRVKEPRNVQRENWARLPLSRASGNLVDPAVVQKTFHIFSWEIEPSASGHPWDRILLSPLINSCVSLTMGENRVIH